MSKHTPKGANTTWQALADIGRHWQTCSYRRVFCLRWALLSTLNVLRHLARNRHYPQVFVRIHGLACISTRTARLHVLFAPGQQLHTVIRYGRNWPYRTCRSVLRGTSWKVLQCSYMFLLHCGCVASLRKVCGWSFESWLRNSGLSAAWSRGQSLDR